MTVVTAILLRVALPVLAAASLVSCSSLPRVPTVQDRAERVSSEVAAIRGLDWKQRLPINTMPMAELAKMLEEDLNETWEDEGADLERAYKAFGLLPADMDLRPWYRDFMAGQIAAFYHPKKKALYTVAEQAATPEGEAMQGFVFAHEYLHALEDQCFDFEKAKDAMKLNEDRQTAYEALVEGSAVDGAVEHTLWESGLPLTGAGPLVRTLARIFADVDVGDVTSLTKNSDASTEALVDAPPLIRDSLLFPYLKGWRFVNGLRAEFGWQGVDEAYRDPPESSEQILHPERYTDRRDRPVRIELPPCPAGWAAGHQGTLGMLTVQILLASQLNEKAAKAAEGWDGDRYVLWDAPDGTVVGWVSAWDRAWQAKRFTRTYTRLLERNAPHAGAWAVTRRGNVVAVVQGKAGEKAAEIATALLDSKITVAEDDQCPPGLLSRLLLWPVCLRPLDRVWEVSALGGLLLDGRFHAKGYSLRVADSLLLHTESSPDRAEFWTAAGLVGGLSDPSVGVFYMRVPFVINCHRRKSLIGEDSRSRYSAALGTVCYKREGKAREFSLLWGLLLKARWGDENEHGTRLRVLLVPLIR